MQTLIGRLLGRERDGDSAVLEAHATGIPAGMLEGGAADAQAAPGRRQRALSTPHTLLLDSVGTKILHFWLQNRHQTLFPLTVNLRAVPPHHAELLAQMAAVALLAGSPGRAELDAARAWLHSVGGDDTVVAWFEHALAAPPAASTLIGAVQQEKLAALAYVVSLVSLGQHDLAGMLYLEYLAVRLNLPLNVVRSANRRYRR